MNINVLQDMIEDYNNKIHSRTKKNQLIFIYIMQNQSRKK
jgi:hypothetical protein